MREDPIGCMLTWALNVKWWSIDIQGCATRTRNASDEETNVECGELRANKWVGALLREWVVVKGWGVGCR